ncbi:MAG: right-handed parallel beta-helix repeat-containing protein, partial [bacterium]
MKKFGSLTLLSLFCIIPNLVLAANHYVRAGATGSNNGSDWNNAWTSLPANLIRGDTYYIADGNYPEYTFDDAASGSAYIYIKKAIASDHGTDTGWNSSYGDGQAFFGVFTFLTGYYEIDGQIGGGPARWNSGHGFKMKATSANEKVVRIENGVSNIIIKHCELEHRGLNTGTSDDGLYGFNASNITLSHCYMHDFGRVPFLWRNWNNVTIEYCYIARNTSTPAQHAEGLSDSGSDNVIIRYNIWSEIQGTAFIVGLEHGGLAANWEIYGNVFSRGDVAGVIQILNDASNNASAENWKIYNNTIVNVGGLWSGFRFDAGSNNVAYNNLWYNCVRTAHSRVTISHSWYYNTQNDGDNVAVQMGTGNPFVDLANENFHLAAATQNGKADLGSPYNADADGKIRGSDGVW